MASSSTVQNWGTNRHRFMCASQKEDSVECKCKNENTYISHFKRAEINITIRVLNYFLKSLITKEFTRGNNCTNHQFTRIVADKKSEANICPILSNRAVTIHTSIDSYLLARIRDMELFFFLPFLSSKICICIHQQVVYTYVLRNCVLISKLTILKHSYFFF